MKTVFPSGRIPVMPNGIFSGYSSLDISIQEGRDWFDINAKVRFGEFEIPFIQLRNYILNRKKEFLLPNGEIAVIPEWWFTKYSEFFSFTENHHDDDHFRLRMHHLALVQELKEENLATAVISRKLENLRDFNHIESAEPAGAFSRDTCALTRKPVTTGSIFSNNTGSADALPMIWVLGKTVQTLGFTAVGERSRVCESRRC